jgi:predicted XRE-type DNA-binding protein
VSTNGTRRPKTAKSIAGSGNVFADIGFADADEMLARSELVRHINRIIQQRRLNQVDAAKLLGINQPKVSALKCGRITEFSIDRLMRFLVALGQGVDISIRPASHAGLRVTRLRRSGKLPEVA